MSVQSLDSVVVGENAESFDELGVSAPILKRLAAKGIDKPFPIQSLAIPDAIAGRDILGKAKTGSGKTIAFGVPLVQRMKPGENGTQALVLVPTRELAAQVAEELEWLSPKGARIVAAYGGVGLGQHIKGAPKAHILVATPGRLIDLIGRGAARLDRVHILVIDEADRMADMGFLPQVAKILPHVPKERQTMLFSATLDASIVGLVAQTQDPVHHEVAEKRPTVETVEHHLFEVHHVDKTEVLAAVLRSPRELALVFTRTKRGCDRLANQLSKAGVTAAPIHGDLPQNARERALERFEQGKVDVLVATDVAARGLDIEGISMVVNFDPPEDHKAYLHRVGRTARAGRSGVAVTLCTWEQRSDVERMAKRLRLHPHIVEVFSSDPQLEKVGTGELAPARPLSEEELPDSPESSAAPFRNLPASFRRPRRR